MSKFHTLLKIARTLLKDPYTLRRVLVEETEQVRSHDDIYDNQYFQFVEQTTAQSADIIASSILHSFRPSSVVDVGCGTGVLLERLRAYGVQVKGLEYAEAALKYCQMRGLDVVKFDVEAGRLLTEVKNADVVVSMEVGQQIHAASADRYIDLLCGIANIIVFSSATPGQGDRAPRNEKPHQYWIEKFAQRGYRFEEVLSVQWRKEWEGRGTAPWFYRNVLIFRCYPQGG
jgi:SAM-dependent methyltransferase